MARGVRFLLGSRQYPFLKKNGPGIPVFGYCPLFFVRPTPGHNPVSGLLSTEGFQLRSFCTCSIYFERVFLFLRRPFWKGAPYFECTEVWGAVSRHDHCRQQQPTTNYVALCSTFNAWNIQRENSNTRWRIDTDACVHPLTSPANLVFFLHVGAHVALCCVALSYLGHQNELTLVRTSTETYPKSD